MEDGEVDFDVSAYVRCRLCELMTLNSDSVLGIALRQRLLSSVDWNTSVIVVNRSEVLQVKRSADFVSVGVGKVNKVWAVSGPRRCFLVHI